MTSILKTDEIQSQNGGAVVKMQTLKHPSASGNNLELASDGTTSFNGNVGIGANAPPVGLSVQGGTADKATIQIKQTASSGADYRISSRDDGSLRFNNDTAGVERMRIDSSGNLLVAKTSTDLSTPGFNVDVRSGVMNGVGIIKNDTNWGTALFIRRNSTAGTGAAMEFSNNGTTVGTVMINSSSTSYNTTSDYRLKENVTPITSAIDRLNQLKPSRFNFIADPDTTLDGFLAHEVSDHVPEAVSGEKDQVDEDGEIKPQGIDQSKLVPLLVASVQELSAKVTALENATN